MAEPQSHHRLLPRTNHERLEHEEQVLQLLAAQLQQSVAFAVAQLHSSLQGVGALLVAGDAVEGEPCPSSVSRVRWWCRSGSRPPPGSGGPRPTPGLGRLLLGRSMAEQFHEHQGLVDGAHAHALGDGVPQALVGGGGGRGMEESSLG
jgi:hypothetical protein